MIPHSPAVTIVFFVTKVKKDEYALADPFPVLTLTAWYNPLRILLYLLQLPPPYLEQFF